MIIPQNSTALNYHIIAKMVLYDFFLVGLIKEILVHEHRHLSLTAYPQRPLWAR
jgi:hypothetical protein